MKISISTYRWGFWFRVNGHGLSVQIGGPISFSERMGYHKCFRIGSFRVKFLPKIP